MPQMTHFMYYHIIRHFRQGFEEIEGLTVVDILRRAGINAQTISIMGTREVCGSHRIPVIADELFEDVDFEKLDGVVLPGGLPGTTGCDSNASDDTFHVLPHNPPLQAAPGLYAS